MRKPILVFCVVFLARPLGADALSDLRVVLASLTGLSEVTATASVEVWMEEAKGEKKRYGKATVELYDGTAGMRVTYPRGELQRAEEEHRKSPDDPRPTLIVLNMLDALTLQELLNFATTLLRMLEHAKALEQSEVTFQGKPARLLKLKVEMLMSAAAPLRIKEVDNTVQLWIDAQGIPLAGRQTQLVKGSFLLMKFERRETESLSFAQVGDRLIVTEREEEQSSSGLGQAGRTRKVTKLQLR